MSNKDVAKLNPLDLLIRRTLRLGMNDKASYLQIDFIWGFELFNTRAYHNYETWSGGYRVTDTHNGIRVQSEDLDDALKDWALALESKRETGEVPRYARLIEPKPVAAAPPEGA